jgi:hypothetical protein
MATSRTADAPGVSTGAIHEDDLLIVARVAEREGWQGLEPPPSAHPPRTLAEQTALARFGASMGAPERRRRARVGHEAKVRLAMVAAALVVLGACWWVSPARTALGLLGAGIVCLVAARRHRRGAGSGRGAPRAAPFGRGAALRPR